MVVRISIAIPFFFGFGLFVSRQFSGAGSSLRSVAGLEDVLDESCGIGVEDELVPEMDGNPGTTRGTNLSVLHMILFPCLVRCGFWPLTNSLEYPWSSQSLPGDRTAGVSSGNCTVTKRPRS